MRRFVAYATLAASMLVAVGVGITPVLTSMQPGREFTTGKEITFNVRSEDDGNLPSNALDEVANEMRNRLDSFDFEDYSIKIESNFSDKDAETKKEGSITVSLACEQDTFDNVCRYLTFSGENFSLSGKDESGIQTDVIDYKNVEIIQYNDLVPILVIPLTDTGKSKVEKLITDNGGNIEQDSSIKMKDRNPSHNMHDGDEHDHEEGVEEPVTPDIFLWGNYVDGDNFTAAQSDPNVANKIVMSFVSDNIWYTKADGYKGDEEHTAIKFVCGSMDEENKTYDFGKLKNANNMANYYYNMLHANKYDYEVSCPTVNITSTAGFDYYTNARDVAPFAGANNALFDYSNILTVKFTVTILTTLMLLVALSVCFGIFFKLMAPAIITTSVASTFLTYLLFSNLGALFNVPSLIAGFIVLFLSLFVEIFYCFKFRDEVYKGRSLKKANQEASKKSNLVTLDVSVIGAISGLMTYLLGGVALKSMGVVLFFGSIISLLMNLIVFKFLMYLVTNSTSLQNKPRLFGIHENKIPNLMLEQKQNYTNPLEKVPFTEPKKIGGIVLGALTAIGLAGVMIFGIANGSPLNIDRASQDKTIAYVEINTESTQINSETAFKEIAMQNIAAEGVSEDYTIVLNEVVKDSLVNDKIETEQSYFFTVTINQKFNSTKLLDIRDNISNAISVVLPSDYTVSVYNSHELVYTPDQGLVALATGISLAAAMIYLILRYKPSRGIAATLVSAGAALSAYGILALTRIGTTAVSVLAMPIIGLSTLIAAVPYLNLEKIMLKEYEGELTTEVKNDIMKKAIAKSAMITTMFSLISLFAAIMFFGFGMQITTFLFASTIVGELIGFGANYIVLGPFANWISNLLAKIRLPKIKFNKNKNVNLQPKQKSSEPEETTFIGIND